MPEKRPTLPRLELLSCELAAGLVKTITSAIKIEWQVTCWSDSKVALGWIRGNPQRWKQFVRNRVLFIANNTCSSWWRHVPGLENPVDLCSRGASAGKLIPAAIWWHGTSWLSADSAHWKMETTPTCDETTTSLIENETRSTPVVAMATAIESPRINWPSVSSYYKLVRVIAWIKRVKKNTGSRRSDVRMIPIKVLDREIMVDTLDTTELQQAELAIFQLIQKEQLGDIYDDVAGGKDFSDKHTLAKWSPNGIPAVDSSEYQEEWNMRGMRIGNRRS